MSARFGEQVPLPTALEGPIWARIEVDRTLAGSLISLFYKPSGVVMTTIMADGRSLKWRLIPGMARGGFLLSPVVNDIESFAALAAGDRPTLAALEPAAVSISQKDGAPWINCYRPVVRLHLYRLQFPTQELGFK